MHPVVLPSGLCVAHDAEHHVSKRFQSGPEHTTTGGRPKRPPAPEVLRELVERQVEKIVGVYLDGLDAEEHAVRMQAARELLDRAYGKPKQAVDVDHTSGGQSLAELFAATPLGQAHSELPVDEEELDG